MHVPKSFTDQVVLKFRLYSGLFHDLPYDYVSMAGNTLPLFAQFAREGLEAGRRPDAIVQEFFETRLGVTQFKDILDRLFAFIRLAERQIVLFDAVEDASFHHTRDLEGPGSLHEAQGRIEGQGLVDEARRLLADFGVRIVLTAHPTQFYTEPVLGIIAELREAIRQDDVAEVNRLLLQLGRTRFKKKEKPKPYDEARAILWFMEHVLYGVVPQVHRTLLSLAGLEGPEALDHRALVELGFWPGGDRDGNPNVTSETSLQVADLLRQSLLGLYAREAAALARRLTFDGILEGLDGIAGRLEASRRDPQSARAYKSAAELLGELNTLRTALTERHQGLFLDELDAFITRVRVFGFHFGILDLRQDSRVLARALNEVFRVLDPGRPLFSSLDQAARLERLATVNEARFTGKYQTVLPSLEDPVLRDCLEVFAAAREIQTRNGERAVHRFIISNTQGAADVMGARLLALCAGWSPEDLRLDIVPLFETVDDLKNAPEIMETLWSLPLYRRHVETRGQVQNIMLGFSDGTKDGGYLSANWHIYRAKQALTELAGRFGLRPIFFDGRGGPPARGGGNTHKFYRSLGRDIEGRTIHLTIQGQTISSTYGTPLSARYNLEQLASAAFDNYLYPQNEDWHLDAQEAALLDELSDLSHKAYTALRDHPEFLPYLEHLSPLRYYAQANNSSRPAKRPGKGGLTLGDLRAIPFVGAWSQLKQNIPGYFGLGSALSALERQGRLNEAQALYTGSLYFRTLVENSMQSLSKVHLPLTAWVKEDPRFAAFHRLIVEEAERTKAYLLKVSGQEELLAQDPLNRASIRMREDLLVPMSVIQQYALIHLRRLRESEGAASAGALAGPGAGSPGWPGPEDGAVLEKIVVKTMAASVNASRNSV